MITLTIEQPNFQDALMGRIAANRSETRRFPWRWAWTPVAAAVMLLAIAWFGIHASFPPSMTPPEGPGNLAALPNTVSDHQTPAAPEEPVNAIVQPPANTDAPLPLDIQLLGTLTGSEPAATIALPGGETTTVHPGETIVDGVVLQEVRRREVVVDNRGTAEVLGLNEGTLGEEAPDLTGTWLLESEVVPGGTISEMVELKNENGRLVVYKYNTQFAVATRTGRLLNLTMTNPLGDGIVIVLHGSFASDWRSAVLSPTKECLELVPVGFPQNFVLNLKREVDEETFERTIRESREMAAGALAQALKKYADAHGQDLPGTLEELVPGYIADVADFLPGEGRKVTYSPHCAPLQRSNSFQRPLTGFEDTDSSLPYPDRLIEWESASEAIGMRDVLFPSSILTIEYEEPPQVLSILCAANWPMVTARSVSNASPNWPRVIERADPNEDPNALRATCANNLKQLGLTIKTFENAHHGFTPPGFCCAYPEYLTNILALTCPAEEPNTDSYIYLTPATNIEEIAKQATEGDPNPAATAIYESEWPMMVERAAHPTDEGRRRNVLFADGHVEAIAVDSPDWNQIAPRLPGR